MNAFWLNASLEWLNMDDLRGIFTHQRHSCGESLKNAINILNNNESNEREVLMSAANSGIKTALNMDESYDR